MRLPAQYGALTQSAPGNAGRGPPMHHSSRCNGGLPLRRNGGLPLTVHLATPTCNRQCSILPPSFSWREQSPSPPAPPAAAGKPASFLDGWVVPDMIWNLPAIRSAEATEPTASSSQSADCPEAATVSSCAEGVPSSFITVLPPACAASAEDVASSASRTLLAAAAAGGPEAAAALDTAARLLSSTPAPAVLPSPAAVASAATVLAAATCAGAERLLPSAAAASPSAQPSSAPPTPAAAEPAVEASVLSALPSVPSCSNVDAKAEVLCRRRLVVRTSCRCCCWCCSVLTLLLWASTKAACRRAADREAVRKRGKQMAGGQGWSRGQCSRGMRCSIDASAQ